MEGGTTYLTPHLMCLNFHETLRVSAPSLVCLSLYEMRSFHSVSTLTAFWTSGSVSVPL